jgi:hypothetical protein
MNRTSRDFGGVLLAAAAALSGCTGPDNDHASGRSSTSNEAESGASPGNSGSSGASPSNSGSNAGGDRSDPGSPAGAPNGGGGGTGGLAAGGKPGTDLSPPDPSCGLPNAAFCDAFTKASPGGRAGALDDARWSLSRLGFGCGYSFMFPETPVNLCGVWKTVEPGGPDSEFCLNENNEPRWAEGFDDNTDFNYLSARIRQPFDFEGRTGTVTWQADARTSGNHGWWTEMWITADPVPGPNLHDPDQLVTSSEALAISFDLNCGVSAAGLGTAGSGLVGVSRILVVHDHAFTHKYDPFTGPLANQRCVKTEQNAMNTFQIKLGKDRVEVWAADAGSTELTQIAEADIDLGFTRGYVHLSHVHYNARKAEVSTFQSYQWAHVAFDGPQLPPPRAYEIADPLTKLHTDCLDKDAFRIAYGVTDDVVFDISTGPTTPLTLKFTDVDPTGGVSAHLNFDTTYVAAGDTLRYRLNGKSWHDYVMPATYVTNWARQGFSVPVPVADLVAGDNSVEFGTSSNPGFAVPANSMQIANIDLEIEAP